MLRRPVLAAIVSTFLGVVGSAAASGPTVAQIKAAYATHSHNFVLANAWAYGQQAPGHGWIDLRTGSGRWVSGNGKLVTLESVGAPDPFDRTLTEVTETVINYATRTWYRTEHEEPTQIARFNVVDPLAGAPQGARFTLLGVETVDGQPTYHLRSTYYGYGSQSARLDVWFTTDQDYLIRATRTTRDGDVLSRVDNR